MGLFLLLRVLFQLRVYQGKITVLIHELRFITIKILLAISNGNFNFTETQLLNILWQLSYFSAHVIGKTLCRHL